MMLHQIYDDAQTWVHRHPWRIAILTFAFGLAIGLFARYEIFANQTEKDWRNQYGEDSSHKRIMAFQNALDHVAPKDRTALSQQMDLQLKIEELVIQSRAAQYSNITPFTSLGSSAVTLFIGLLGIVGGWIGHKKSMASGKSTAEADGPDAPS